MKNFLKRNKVTIISLCIMLIILFCYVCSAQAYTYESIDFQYGKVIAKTSLNIRCGPGTNYERVGKLNNGEYVNVFAKVGDWYIIQTNNSVVGAVSSKYIEPIYDEIDFKVEETAQTSSAVESNGEYLDNLSLTVEEQEFLNLINSNRKTNGLDELKIDNTIQNVARLKAQDLERNEYFSHQSPTYGNINDMLTSFGVTYTSAQENIAGNQNLAGAVEAWMNSESHKANILNNDFKYTGVAVVESSTYGKIFVEVFVKK
ncbi:MAG: SH3 domain-containing protein [Clostridia bacterium]|nr:SH3 domain-containing protein [Clostridia bacterium]